MHVYVCAPIDLGWDRLPSVELAEGAGDHEVLASLQEELARAKALAHTAGWEGDFRELPRVIWLPFPETAQFEPAFVWKQDNNGVVFVVSPVRLSWLEKAHSAELGGVQGVTLECPCGPNCPTCLRIKCLGTAAPETIVESARKLIDDILASVRFRRGSDMN